VKQTFAAIQQIHQEGKTVRIVEQNAATSLSIADRGYALQSGQVVLQGPASAELAADRRLRDACMGHAD
jgi:branched-chain amino acid transport system ATP-binding protein